MASPPLSEARQQVILAEMATVLAGPSFRMSKRCQEGSGANWAAARIRTLRLHRSDSDIDHAASAARQISGSVARRPPSLPNLNCPFLIFSASSIPLITTSAVLKLFSPNIGRNRGLILR